MVLGVAKTIVGSTLCRGMGIISVSSILFITSSGDSRLQNQDTTALYVYGKLPTYPSLKPTSTLNPHLRQNVGLGEG